MNKGSAMISSQASLNINVGILGHVDSGKTSIGIASYKFSSSSAIAKVLSSVKSTAAFDNCRQSRERGITIDLGFSSFKLSESSF